MGIKLTFYDKLLIVSVLVLSLATFFFNYRLDAQGAQKYISIFVNNNFIKEISFDDQTESTVMFPFGKNNEYTATLKISRGKVRLLPLPEDLCPRGICSHTGWISRDYESIVCVPNRILVAFRGEEAQEFDGITY